LQDGWLWSMERRVGDKKGVRVGYDERKLWRREKDCVGVARFFRAEAAILGYRSAKPKNA